MFFERLVAFVQRTEYRRLGFFQLWPAKQKGKAHRTDGKVSVDLNEVGQEGVFA